MKTFKNIFIVGLTALAIAPAAQAEHVTIIAVNDTHSQIDPASDNKGGALRRRAIYDKVRSENKYTMTLHAGDAVHRVLHLIDHALKQSVGHTFFSLILSFVNPVVSFCQNADRFFLHE